MLSAKPPDRAAIAADYNWVDTYLLAGRDSEVCLGLDVPVTRGALTAQVLARSAELVSAGLWPGGTISLRLPPGLAYVVNLLAAWRIGAQVSLLDHRLTTHEVDRALARIAPQLVVSAPDIPIRPLHGHSAAATIITRYPGRRAQTGHALLQLSSGSTGPSKVIGRTSADLMAEIERYRQIEGTPLPGERVVLLASMVHMFGLVGGLLYGLHTGVQLVVPRFLSTAAILGAVAAGSERTTILGVPFHVAMLTTADLVPRLPQLKRMTVGGELMPSGVYGSFVDKYRVPLGNMYGMTEAGVIATDMFGAHRPALRPAPGMRLREESGQLLLAVAASPYVGLTEPGRWVGGWLYTKDAGRVDPVTGLVTVCGRLDSQVSVGGLKVDLTEVEQTLAGLPGVVEAVVVHDGAIEAFVVVDSPDTATGLKEALADRLASYKRPRRVNFLARLPRTSSGKLIRNLAALRAAQAEHREPAAKESATHV